MNETFAALLNGNAIPWSAFGMPDDEFLRTCHDRDLICLIGERLRSSNVGRDWPARVCDAVSATAHAQTAKEMLRRREIMSLLEALAAEGIQPVVMKGTALAYGLYGTPSERPRIDTDLLIRRADVDLIRRKMTQLGYRSPAYCDGELFGQFPMRKVDAFGIVHTLDFHWKISTQPVFAEVLGFDELADAAVDLPALGRRARMPGYVHTLLLACIHPVMHHRNAELLIWTYDIHLIASRLSASEFAAFAELAVERRVSAICARQLSLARERFGTLIPGKVAARLSADRREPSSEYLKPNRRWRDEFISSLRGLPRWRDRVRLVREVFFPERSYMLASYRIRDSSAAGVLLPALHIHRLAAGALKIVSGRK